MKLLKNNFRIGGNVLGRKEAFLYQTLGDNMVKCRLCAHRCRIKPGATGICRVRENKEGALYTLVYGKAIARNVDPMEKKPLFHFLPGTLSYSLATVGCNFRCRFCQNWEISQGVKDNIPGETILPEKIVEEAIFYKCQSISYTYTEPTVFFEYAYETAEIAREKGLRNVFVTNGYQTPETVAMMKGVIDAANIDLKSFSDDFYSRVCQAHLEPVLETIRNMHNAGITIEVTTLVVPGENDSPDELKGIAEFLVSISADIPWHLSAFSPCHQMQDARSTPAEVIHRAIEVGKKTGLNYVYSGNLPQNSCEDSVCPYCGKTIIARSWFGVRKIDLKEKSYCYCGKKLPFELS
ncbi:AmmeMemoRadiSam system radical SAM enzyme [candidate division NPL-UPA2 bacterium Unc8]|uniref:AmmeMemoRadiSam system radical SAM enzyme n=1 Tax=candidate division NPL-UPA2 bacterium Unc8 TaxID=1980939 RepID=A0A399FWH8_UNCN2|nr:MAG: AmmeMemoRadiSam system radical SAM enzyme [candidate division NPL-UPA2 bacterium Unc8]